MTQNRFYYLDNAKFFLMYLVVIGHVLDFMMQTETGKIAWLVIFSFHMPLFIMISGYLSKYSRKDELKVVVSLLVPYFLFQVCFVALSYEQLNYYDESIFKVIANQILEPNFTLWYLLSLFCWRLILPYVTKFRHPIFVSIVVAILAGYSGRIDTFMSLSRTLSFLPFFLIGYYATREQLEGVFKQRTWKLIVSLTVFILATNIFANYVHVFDYRLLWYGEPFGRLGHAEWYAGLYRIGLMATAFVLSVAFMYLVPRNKVLCISDWGARSIYPYLLHGLLIKLLTDQIVNSTYSTSERFVVILIATVGYIILCFKATRVVTKYVVEPSNIRYRKTLN